MNIEEVTNRLIVDDFKNEVVICVSGNFHKVEDIQTIGNKTLLNVAGSIKVIRQDALDLYHHLSKEGSLIFESKDAVDLTFTETIKAIKMILTGQRSTLFNTWQYDIDALKELCRVLGYNDEGLS